MGFDPTYVLTYSKRDLSLFDFRPKRHVSFDRKLAGDRFVVKRFTRYFHLEATGTKRAARDGEADTNAGIDTQRWRKPARRAGCISRPWKRSNGEERRHPVSRIPSRSETERGGLTGVQSTRMLCMQMRSDRPIGYPVLERPPHGSSSSRSLLPCPLAGPWTEARLGLWSLDSV